MMQGTDHMSPWEQLQVGARRRLSQCRDSDNFCLLHFLKIEQLLYFMDSC
jgi:hypothetical protein